MSLSSFSEFKRLSFLPLAGLALAAYYLFVFQPLARRAQDLDAPLEKSWRTLTTALDQTNAMAVDFRLITNQLQHTRRALTILDEARQQAAARLELGPSLREKLRGPFQLVEYENERSKKLDLLHKQSAQQQVTIEPSVYLGFPEHTVDVQQPALLWAALSFIDGLLNTALQNKVSAIHSLEVPLLLTNAPSADTAGRLAEIPLLVELTGPVANVARLVQSLPLRAPEIRAAGLPEAGPDKQPLFVDRLLLKKQTPDKPDEVRVWLRVVGYVIRE